MHHEAGREEGPVGSKRKKAAGGKRERKGQGGGGAAVEMRGRRSRRVEKNEGKRREAVAKGEGGDVLRNDDWRVTFTTTVGDDGHKIGDSVGNHWCQLLKGREKGRWQW